MQNNVYLNNLTFWPHYALFILFCLVTKYVEDVVSSKEVIFFIACLCNTVNTIAWNILSDF